MRIWIVLVMEDHNYISIINIEEYAQVASGVNSIVRTRKEDSHQQLT